VNSLCDMAVIVTGAASGIGRATAELLVCKGARVLVADVSEERIAETLAALAPRDAPLAIGQACDVRNADDCQRLVDVAQRQFGRIDALVHSAGVLRPLGVRPRPLVEVDDAEYDAVIGTNLKGTFLINRAVLRRMIEQRSGQIINLASTSGRRGRAFDSVYSASKAGVIGLSESAAEEVRGYGIRVQVILPDAIDTPMWQQNGPVPKPPGALPPERVAEVIAMCLTLPENATCEQLIVAPLAARRLRGGAGSREASS